MKFIVLHHRLGGYSSHHYNEALGLRRELAQRGHELVLLVNAAAQPRLVGELQARAVLVDPTFRMEWSFEERSGRFVDLLRRHVQPRTTRGDCLLVTIATQLEAHALTRWLQQLPPRKKPYIVVLFLSDRWNRAGREEYERQAAELRTLGGAIAGLTPDDANRMVFCAATDALAAELSGLLGTAVASAPMPLPYGVPHPDRAPKPAGALPCVAILGGTRREKGSYRIADIIRACRSLADVIFLVHLTNDTLTVAESEQLARIADEPNVAVLREALPLPEYEAALGRADLVLLPYEVIPYRQRTSGVFGEAVAFGKPVVVTAGTWMAEQVAAGRAAGTIADDGQPESYAHAIARCVANLDEHRRAAAAASDAWRRTGSLTAFLDFVDAQLAERSHREAPRRRPLWPF
jgi:hypothetical protein